MDRKNNPDREALTDSFITPTYGRRWNTHPIPKDRIPKGSMEPKVVNRLIKDEMNLEGNPALNLATFVTTWMEPEAEELMQLGATKNLVDEDEYPQLKIIEERLIRMEANLFNVPEDCKPTGVTTIGSSEAIMLGLLAHKWSWKKRRQEEGKSTDKPNVIFGADVHTCWEKFARYFDVEMRVIELQHDTFTISADDVAPLIDENTIAVGVIVGTTFTGQVDDIQGINQLLLDHKAKTGHNIPIHVDAASGGFIMPFVDPDYLWDFRLEQVRTINVSNHKFGLVYAGMGSVVFKDESDLPEELPFNINYLGGTMRNYSLNFSKSSSNLLAQYYMFLRLGMDGYQSIVDAIMENAKYIEEGLVDSGYFELLTEGKLMPTVVVRLKEGLNFNCYQISDDLRKFGWIVPAYSLPPKAEDVVVLRMVVKENFSRDLAEKLIQDVKNVIAQLEKENGKKKPAADSNQVLKEHGVC